MKHKIFAVFAVYLLSCFSANAATTLLPNGKQCFTDANGAIVAGSINMFYPATTNPKPTWQDSNQNTLNSQPIQLDGNGCAVIYGIGSYRQQVFDGPVVAGSTTGTLIFDQLTTDTSAYNAVFWAGLSGGTPNVITVVDPGFNGTDGTVINFTALASNTGATTINPSGFAAISVVKDTAAGPVSLIGGEIIQNNIISVVYNATSNTFHLLNTAIPSASGNTAPLCGATNLKIANNVGTPNTNIVITADTALMVTPVGAVINRSTISQAVNISTGTVTSAAGGMDGENPGTNAWIYIWLIDNGSAPAALATAAAGNGLTPNMPSGYTFKCRIGAMRVDGAGNLMHTLQSGNRAQYVVTLGTNTANMPIMDFIAGVQKVAWATVPIASFVPPTATEIAGSLFIEDVGNIGARAVIAAPSDNYSTNIATPGSPAAPISVWIGGNGINPANYSSGMFNFVLERTNIYWGSTAVSPTTVADLFCLGWKDSVNAP